MLNEIRKKIKKYRKAKYQKIVFSKNDVILRKKTIKFISQTLDNKELEKKKCPSCNFYSKYLNQKNLLVFFRKFNSKLALKERYNNKTLKKISNKNACFRAYILFGQSIKKNKKINNIQKLNTILKLIDLLILIFRKKKHSFFIKDFVGIINYEKKLLSKFL